MVQTIAADRVTLYDLEHRFQLQQTEDPSFFPDTLDRDNLSWGKTMIWGACCRSSNIWRLWLGKQGDDYIRLSSNTRTSPKANSPCMLEVGFVLMGCHFWS